MFGIDLRTARAARSLAGAVVAMGLGLGSQSAHAVQEYGDQIPNLVAAGGCDGLCHAAPGGALSSQLYLDLEAAGFVWNAAMANADSDGDGYSNGWELQDPSGTWISGTAYPGSAAFVSNPTLSGSRPPLPVATAPTAIVHNEAAGQNGSEDLLVENVGGVPFDYTLTPSDSWMTPDPSSAQALPPSQQDAILVFFATGGLGTGLYQGDLTLTIAGIRADLIPLIPVDLTVPEPDAIASGSLAALSLGLLARRRASRTHARLEA